MTSTPTNTLINFVLDSSGSMNSVRRATIDGFNSFVTDQAAVPGDARISLTLFDTELDARYVAIPIGGISPLGHDDNPYVPGGMTALLDAVAVTIKGTEAWIDNHSFEGRVLCVILTDGQENSSTEWHIRQPPVPGDDHDVAQLIAHKQSVDGWEFVFLGAGGADWLEQTFGHVVDRDRIHATGADTEGTKETYARLSQSMTSARVAGASFNYEPDPDEA